MTTLKNSFYFYHILREVAHNEWFTISIVLAIGILALAKHLFAQRFRDFLAVIGNSKYLKIYIREQKFFDVFDTLLFVNLVISVCIFGYLAYSVFVDDTELSLITYLKLLLGIGAIVVIKIMIERLVGSLFEIDKLIDSILFQKTAYKNYTGLLLLPANILLIYTIVPTATWIYIIVGLVMLLNIMGFLTTFRNHQNLLLNNLFYFILYLCALEIGPYILLYGFFFAYKA